MSSLNRFSYNQALAAESGVRLQSSKRRPPSAENSTSFGGPSEASFSSSSDGRSGTAAATVLHVEDCEIDLNSNNGKLEWFLLGEQLKHREWLSTYERPDLPHSLIAGQLFVTNYRIRFECSQFKVASKHEFCFDVTLGSVSKLEKVGFRNVRKGAADDLYGIDVVCKELRNVRLLLRRDARGRRSALYSCMRKHAFPNTNRLPFFATLYCERFTHDGWALFDVVNEFERQKVPWQAWRMSRINEQYQFAGTYPSVFFVPADVFNNKAVADPDVFLNLVSAFRSKKRIPALSWIDHRTCAALVRSAQPLVGALARKSAKDEEYLEMIINANPQSRRLLIVDARPKINARANRANGGGYEDHYARCTIQFMDIQNIHEVRKSLKRLKDACFPRISQKYFHRTLEDTKWLTHLQTILGAAALAAREIEWCRNSVLVHCSDGWDRTAQITSLAMLQLDPFYRTIEGFGVLVEKEWCSFGHKFAQRVGHGQEKPEDAERSPIFVQFIDCVWQLYNQFTAAFQFNVRFLKTLLDELYSCRFGTFLYNSERERHDLEVKHNTVSLWSYILDNKPIFTNPRYEPGTGLDDFVRQQTLVHPLFWTDYYCRYSQLVPAQQDDDHDEKDLISSTASNSFEGGGAGELTAAGPTNRTIFVNTVLSCAEDSPGSADEAVRRQPPKWMPNGQQQLHSGALVNELKQRYFNQNANNDSVVSNCSETSSPPRTNPWTGGSSRRAAPPPPPPKPSPSPSQQEQQQQHIFTRV